MDYKTQFLDAIEEGKILLFLEGIAPYKIESSQYAPSNEPTDIGKILSKAVYKAYLEEKSIKEIFETALLSMINGSVQDIYMVVLYISSQLFKEKNKLSPFKLDIERIVPKLQFTLEENKEKLSGEVELWDGSKIKNLWIRIVRLDKVCVEEYGIKLIQ